MSHKDVIKKKSPTMLLISSVVVIAGICIAIFVHNKTVDIIAYLLMFTGIILALCSKKKYIYAPTGSKLICQECHFNPSERVVLGEILDSANFDRLKALKKAENGIKMEYLVSTKNEFAAVQLFEYVPYKYVESSGVYEFFGNKAKTFAQSIK